MKTENISLIDAINYCDEKGYDIIPFEAAKKYRCMIFLNDVFVREGKNEFLTWFECLKESYYKLYKGLTNG